MELSKACCCKGGDSSEMKLIGAGKKAKVPLGRGKARETWPGRERETGEERPNKGESLNVKGKRWRNSHPRYF